MNILYLHTHDSGRYLDPANSPRPLPNLERFAGSAATFRNAFSAAPTCSPSRGALLTGISPHANGLTGLAHRGFRLHNYDRHLAHYCRNAGMETVLCGVQHIAPDKAEIGYDRVLDGPLDYFSRPATLPHEWDRENARRVAGYLREAGDRPFFLSLGLLSTHRPFPPTPDGCEERRFPPPPAVVPDTPHTREDMARFSASLQVVDEVVGTVLDALEAGGHFSDTVILLTTDHGPAFPEMKATLQDGGTGVSMMLRIPDVADDGRVEQALVSQLDAYPTLLELIGASAPETSEGRSLLPLLRGEVSSVREAVFTETNYHANYEPARAVRTARYKLIRHYREGLSPQPANVDDSPSKSLVEGAGYFAMPRAREQLVDLLLDPIERWDVSVEPSYRRVYRELAGMLENWMEQTNDPLCSGTVPRPAGSRLNRQDAASAEEPTEENVRQQ